MTLMDCRHFFFLIFGTFDVPPFTMNPFKKKECILKQIWTQEANSFILEYISYRQRSQKSFDKVAFRTRVSLLSIKTLVSANPIFLLGISL